MSESYLCERTRCRRWYLCFYFYSFTSITTRTYAYFSLYLISFLFLSVVISHSFRHTVFHQDDPPDAFYIIISGSILVTKRLENGFVRLTAGDGFGQLGIIRKSPRSATCTAYGATDLVRVSAEDYAQILQLQHERALDERVAFLKDVWIR